MPDRKTAASRDNFISDYIEFQDAPLVRVKMAEEQEYFDFKVQGTFRAVDEQRKVLKEQLKSSATWRIHVDAFTPPRYQFILFLVEVLTQNEAEEIVEDLQQKGFEAWYKKFGYKIHFSDGGVFENVRFRVFIGPVGEKHEARTIQTRLLGRYRSQILKVPTRQARGFLELYDEDRKTVLRGQGHVRLEPRGENASITIESIPGIKGGTSFTFSHPVEFHIEDSGRLYLVGNLDLEQYVEGISRAAYREEYPHEFLKASLISLRSAVLANLGMGHMNEPYDFCRTEHCYPSVWGGEMSKGLVAVLKEVDGQFLLKGESICDAQQHPVCGGHTEHINLILNRDIHNAVTGRFDVLEPEKMDLPKNLSDEREAEKWILSRPPVLCNLSGRESLPDFENFRKYFRWVIEISRHDLEEIVKRKTEEDIGMIYDIVPLLRGRSGRLLELEILGSHRVVHLLGDLDIRSTLSETLLPSSCFVIEMEMGVDGSPAHFIFTGAGMGHGVGMCQAGAIAQAQDGRNFMQILEHYFGKVELVDRFPVEYPEAER